MAETRTREEREAAWWDLWWAEDYSWEGLPNKPLQGWVVADGYLREADSGRIYGQPAPEAPSPAEGRAANLQDYWRADPDTGRLRGDAEMAEDLVAVEGQPVFHRIHLPLAFRDGTPTGKADWAYDALDAIITPRIQAQMKADRKPEQPKSGDWLFEDSEQADDRAQFVGAIFVACIVRSVGKEAHLRINCSKSAFICDSDFETASFQGDVRFLDCAFIGAASFVSTKFFGRMNFDRTIFLGPATFDAATFSQKTSFYETAFFGRTRFNAAKFEGPSNFQLCEILG